VTTVTDLEQLETRIRNHLRTDDYEGARSVARRGVKMFGRSVAPKLYPLLWEHAMAHGKDDIRALCLKEQSACDRDNLVGDRMRRVHLASAKGVLQSVDLSFDQDLATLSKNKSLAPSWDLWGNSIRKLDRYLRREIDEIECDDERDANPPESNSYPIVLSAGSGRSGSAAIYDWVSGFQEFAGTRKQYFYLRDFLFCLDHDLDSPRYRAGIVDVFWKSFLGRFLYSTKSAYRKAALARNTMSWLGDRNVARSCQRVLALLTTRTRPDRLPKIGVPGSAGNEAWRFPLLLNTISHMFSAEQRFVANGWLDFDKADAYPYLTNAVICCSVRDPRDVFAEHLLRTRTFDGNVEKFIEQYRNKLSILNGVVSTQKPSNVAVIRFEEFVLSDAVRHQLAQRLAIDDSRERRTDSPFPSLPEVSKNNIGLHKSCTNRAAIDRIQSELSEYCRGV
jgi:hypothetical protein